MPCACLSRVVGADATVVPSNLLHCVILCVHVLSLSCDKRYNSVGKALPCRGSYSAGSAGRSAPPGRAQPASPRLALGAAGGGPFPFPGQHGRGAAVPAAAAPLPAARRCGRQRSARIQPAPQPGRDLRGQRGQRRAGCGPARGELSGAGEGWWGGTHAPGRCFCGAALSVLLRICCHR